MAMAAEEKLEDSDSDTSFLSELEEILNGSKSDTVPGLHFDETYFSKEQVATIESNRNGCQNNFCNFSVSCETWKGDQALTGETLQPWDRFFDWVQCIAVVTFDLEIGQTIETIYPEHATLGEQEKTSICYLAFPDSNSGCMGDTQFHFRVRQNFVKQNSGNTIDGPIYNKAGKSHLMYNQSCPAAFKTDPNYLWGFAYFRQVKDRSLKRGYFQKSLVLLTRLPFVELFRHVTALIAPEFFDKGIVCLESACKEIDQWPFPIPGEKMSLPLMGTVFHVYIMCSSIASPASVTGSPQHSQMSRIRRYVIATDVDLFAVLCPLLPHIQLLWELVLCGEPLVVMANSPSVCSQVVQALVTLIYPLQYCLDYRPFFTIHDAEFKEYTGTHSYPPSVLLGVTNPFFAKALQHWPHIIRMGDMPGSGNSGGGFKVRLKKLTNPKEDSKPGVYTTHKPYLQREKAVFKVIAKGMQTRRPSEVQSALLRRHFLELTQSFIIPLERYMARLMPLQKSISPYKAVPLLKPFKTDDFVASLDQCGPQLTTGVKGDWSGLYQHFFRSPNFDSWFQSRQKEANLKLHALQAEALSQSDMTSWLQGKREVEVVDMVLRLREKLDVVREDQLPVSPDTLDQLEDQLKKVMDGLPEDLRSVLKSS